MSIETSAQRIRNKMLNKTSLWIEQFMEAFNFLDDEWARELIDKLNPRPELHQIMSRHYPMLFAKDLPSKWLLAMRNYATVTKLILDDFPEDFDSQELPEKMLEHLTAIRNAVIKFGPGYI